MKSTDRLKRPADFRRVYDRRRSVSDEWLIVYGCENDFSHCRLGMSVSRKVGPAVLRNRLRRLYREAFRHVRPELSVGLDLVLIPRQGVVPTLDILKASLSRLISTLARRLTREVRTEC